MPLAFRNNGQCAFCAFKASKWLYPWTREQGATTSRSLTWRRPASTTSKQSQPRSKQSEMVWSEPSQYYNSSGSLRRSRGTMSLRSPRTSKSKRPLQPPLSLQPLQRSEQFGRYVQMLVSKLKINLFDRSSVEAKKFREHLSESDFKAAFDRFEKSIETCLQKAQFGTANPLYFKLRNAFYYGYVRGLKQEIKFQLSSCVVQTYAPSLDTSIREKTADLRYPWDWYPATRAMQRTIHLHVGPTNSGKTYHALKRLEAANTGVYAGPLRLLAHEVYTRFNAKGKLCALVTGEEHRIPEGLNHPMCSCTVEMVDLNTKVDVAVIDEIQMISDDTRGWAWTQALLGVQAKEVHLCGELRTVDLIASLCRVMGDKLIIHEYERLSPLKAEKTSLRGSIKKLKKGDAVILFSRVAIHAMKAEIERVTNRRCAVVYGSLPPETRAQQAALFNSPDNDYDFLVASDAVGMGLNLSIKRIVFESTEKNNGVSFQGIPVSTIKQIAGRAGRFRTAQAAVEEGKSIDNKTLAIKENENVGYVTALDPYDLSIVEKALKTDAESLKTAGILPPSTVITRFASYFPPSVPFSYIYLLLLDIAQINHRFNLSRLNSQLAVADLIQHLTLSVTDRIIFMGSPVSLKEPGFSRVVVELAGCVANHTSGELLDIKSVKLELLDMEIDDHPTGKKGYLQEAETLHKALTLYLWLSYRFNGVFRSQALAFHVKDLVEEKINQCLTGINFTAVWESHKQKRIQAREEALKMSAKEDLMISEDLLTEAELVVEDDIDTKEKFKSEEL